MIFPTEIQLNVYDILKLSRMPPTYDIKILEVMLYQIAALQNEIAMPFSFECVYLGIDVFSNVYMMHVSF